jgi:hypothetical protein
MSHVAKLRETEHENLCRATSAWRARRLFAEQRDTGSGYLPEPA